MTAKTAMATQYDLVIMDLDGVVFLGPQVVPSAPAAIQAVVDAGVLIVYATNNASRRGSEVATTLSSMGVPARAENVITSAAAAAAAIAADVPAGSPVYVVGTAALRDEVADVGLVPVADAHGRPVAVVQGYGPRVGWSDLAEACVAVRAGARWVVTNTDTTLPSPRGPLPGNGSLVAALATALGQAPDLVVGKPQPGLFEAASALAAGDGMTPARCLVVGDRLDTDIEGAALAGMDSLLVLTGVSRAPDLLAAAAHRRPTHLAEDLCGLSTVDKDSRIPAWSESDGARAGGWWAGHEGDRLVVAGHGSSADALRVLAAAAWAHPEWTMINPQGPAADRVISELGLGRLQGHAIRSASAS